MAGSVISIAGTSGIVTPYTFSAAANTYIKIADGQTGKLATVVYFSLNATNNTSYGAWYYPDGLGGYTAITDRIYVNSNTQYRNISKYVDAPVGKDLYWGTNTASPGTINGIAGVVFL